MLQAQTRPQAPSDDELYALLLEHETLPDVVKGLVQWVAGCLSEQAVACGIAVDRPKREVLTAASDQATERLLESWLARGESPLAAALGESVSVIGPDEALRASQPEALMVVLPIPLDHGAGAALVLRGTEGGTDSPAVSGAVGHCRRAVCQVLRIATRYAHQCELAAHRAAAMENRTVIDLAIGIVMGQNRCSPEAAFQILRRASNARNHRLADVASGVVASVTAADVHTQFEE